MDMETIMLVVEVALVLTGAYFANYFSQRGLHSLAKFDKLDESILIPAQVLIKWLIILLAILLILRELGISLTVILTSVSGILMLVAIGFVAVWSVLSNVSSSFLLLIFPPFSFGDSIEIREPDKEVGIKGKVIGLNLFYTTLRSRNGEGDTLIRIPNNLFFQRVIICHAGKHTEALKVSMKESFVEEKENA